MILYMKRSSQNESLEKLCKYCERAQELNDEGKMLCPKYGVVEADNDCRRFIYDPLKRRPAKPIKVGDISIEDLPEDI